MFVYNCNCQAGRSPPSANVIFQPWMNNFLAVMQYVYLLISPDIQIGK